MYDLRAEDLAALLAIGRQLASDVDLDTLLGRILDTAGTLTGSEGAAVLLADPEQPGLYFAAATGPASEVLTTKYGQHSKERIPVDASKAGRVFKTGETLVEQAVEEDPEHFKEVDRETRGTTRSLICVPLECVAAGSGGSQRIGVMQIVNKRSGAYQQRDTALAEGLAAWAALALRNAQLFRQLMAHMGLYAHGSLAELSKEMNAPPHREHLTVVFADMRGFTQLLQIIADPERVRGLLNDYLGILTESVLEHGGAVNKFLGDGLLAIFRGRDCARAALSSAFDMLAKFDVARARWDDDSSQSLKFLNMGIGISTGEVIIGPLGYGEVRDFTVIGVPVNLANAYQSAARKGLRVLIDRPTLAATLDLIGQKNDLEDFVLRKPDQDVGIPHKRYHVVSLKSATPGEPAGTKSAMRVFLCHASEDKPLVRTLCSRLKQDGFSPWLDEDELLPGQDWQLEIKRALRVAGAVVVCLSSRSATKEGYLQRELRFVLDIADEKPEGTIFVIPVKFESCELPERLSSLEWVLYSDQGYERLRKALQLRAAVPQVSSGIP